MPNWCSNYATICGSKEEIKKITDILSEKSTYEKDGVLINGGLFESLIGIDPNISREEYDNGGWYNSNCEYWGCKWDVLIKDAYADIYDEEIRISFDTPWSPAVGFCEQLAKKYNVSVNLLYDEPGNDFAGELDVDQDGNVHNREYKYLEGVYHRGDDIFWDEVRSQLDYMIEEEEDVTPEYIGEWLHFLTDVELKDFIEEYKKQLTNRTI